MSDMVRVRSIHSPALWGYVDAEGVITPAAFPNVKHKIVRVIWANDAVSDVPPTLQYAEDLEVIA
jgi:hypothetical protein